MRYNVRIRPAKRLRHNWKTIPVSTFATLRGGKKNVLVDTNEVVTELDHGNNSIIIRIDSHCSSIACDHKGRLQPRGLYSYFVSCQKAKPMVFAKKKSTRAISREHFVEQSLADMTCDLSKFRRRVMCALRCENFATLINPL